MTRLLPFPLVSAGLLVLWLLLNQTLSLGPDPSRQRGRRLSAGGHSAALQLPKARVRRPGAILRLSALVLADIVRSNIAVGRIVLGFGARERTSGFVNIPLDLRDPYGLAVAGLHHHLHARNTVGQLRSARGMLMIHVLDLIDESEWIRTIKGRYERHLLEIFE